MDVVMSVGKGWESWNAGRSHPFSPDPGACVRDVSGEALADDVFVDAAIAPVLPGGTRWAVPFLKFVDTSSDDAIGIDVCGVEVLGVDRGGGRIDLFVDGSECGCVATGPGWERERRLCRRREFADGEARFAASCCMPVFHSGVTEVRADGSGSGSARGGTLFLEGDGVVEPVLTCDGGRYELRFDAVARPASGGDAGIRQVVVAVVGDTVFGLDSDGSDDSATSASASASASSAFISAPVIDRDDVCAMSSAGRSASVSVAVDTCGRDPEPCDGPDLPQKSQAVWLCPTSAGNVSILADDAIGYSNPVRVSVVHGSTSAPEVLISDGMSLSERTGAAKALLGRASVSGNGISIGFAGLSGGVG